MKSLRLLPCISLALVVCVLAISGCGRDGPKRYRVEGAVTYGGQPVQAGRVIFEPDTEAGNSGPAAYADIRQGRYVTLAEMGCVGGPHVVRVICLTGVAEGSELAEGRMVCPEYREHWEVPESNCQHDVDIPGDHVW